MLHCFCRYQCCATRWHFLSPLPHWFSLKGPPKGPSGQTSQITPRRCPDSAQIFPDSLDLPDSAQTLPEHIPALPGLVIVIPFLPDFLLHAISGLHAQKVDSVYSLEYCIHSTVLCIHISAREFLLTLSAPFPISFIARHTSALSLDHIYFHMSYIDWTLFEGSAPAAPLFTSYLLLSRLLLSGWSISRMFWCHRYQPRSPASNGWC